MLEQTAERMASQARAEDTRLRRLAKQLDQDLAADARRPIIVFSKKPLRLPRISMTRPRRPSRGGWPLVGAINLHPAARLSWESVWLGTTS